MMIFFLVVVAIATAGYLFMQQPQFGRLPSGERKQRINASPHFAKGQFQNQSPTPALTEGASMLSVTAAFFFARPRSVTPPMVMPSQRSDLLNLDPAQDVLVWFGHSSYFMQLDGKKILVDPVLSGSASPVKFTTRSFKGSDVFTVSDLPSIDLLFITHDHWDHLDHDTVRQLRPRIGQVITSLGVGAHLERWGYTREMITELDWYESAQPAPRCSVNAVPARHFSGRGFRRNQTLWSSFVLKTASRKIFIGGDSGYDKHFKEAGKEYGPFDLAILENGQYNESWAYIHMMPEEVVQACIDLEANLLLPVHWGKFSLSMHAWNEPVKRVAAEASKRGVSLLLPMIGELVYLDRPVAVHPWWEDGTGR
ncbi:MAG TPA: MBL fold metallo-hydrolase [Flavisolibacter sp.]|nr:MBL fold metallo-hydrolase [Flavisolibacter sp.]